TRSACLDMLAGTRSKLATGRLAAAERAAHFAKVDAEHIVQQEACPLERRETFQHQHQRHRNVVGDILLASSKKCAPAGIRQRATLMTASRRADSNIIESLLSIPSRSMQRRLFYVCF